MTSFETPDYSELFSEEKEMIKKLKKTFLMVAGGAVQKYGPDLEDHQQLLIAASDILIEIVLSDSMAIILILSPALKDFISKSKKFET